MNQTYFYLVNNKLDIVIISPLGLCSHTFQKVVLYFCLMGSWAEYLSEMSPAIYSQTLCFYVNIFVGSWSQALQPKLHPYLQSLQISVLFLISFIKRNCSSDDLTKIPKKAREVFQHALSLWSRWPLVSCSVLWKSLISSSSLTSNDSSQDDNPLYTNNNLAPEAHKDASS